MSDRDRQTYYQMLGVRPTATPDEIAAAYRTLAIKYHPDTSRESSDTDAKFRQIAEAYDVLSDPDKRRHYDRRNAVPTPRPSPAITPSRQVPPNVSLRPSDWVSIWDAFLHHFTGGVNFAGGDNDPLFQTAPPSARIPQQITDDLPVTPEESRDGAIVPIVLTTRHECPDCAGLGQIQSVVCTTCDGKGVVIERRSVSVKLPGGIHDGSLLRISSGPSRSHDMELRIRIRPCW